MVGMQHRKSLVERSIVLNPIKPSGNVPAICTICYAAFFIYGSVFFSLKTAITSLNSVNQLSFVMVKCRVLFEVRTEFLNINLTSLVFKGLIDLQFMLSFSHSRILFSLVCFEGFRMMILCQVTGRIHQKLLLHIGVWYSYIHEPLRC
jgi:hypothetical protein